MKHVLKPIALGVAAMAAIVGCGGSASIAPSGASSAAASQTTASSAEAPRATAAGSAVPSASSPVSLPSLPPITSSHADPALEAQLPAEVSGAALQRYSVSFVDLLDDGGDRASIDAFLASIGKTEADGTFAAAYDPSNTLPGGILAFKVSGAETAALLGGIVALEQSDLGAGATTGQATVGGKNVTVVSVGTGVNDTEWIYGKGDIVFVVHAPDETQAAVFLQALQ